MHFGGTEKLRCIGRVVSRQGGAALLSPTPTSAGHGDRSVAAPWHTRDTGVLQLLAWNDAVKCMTGSKVAPGLWLILRTARFAAAAGEPKQ